MSITAFSSKLITSAAPVSVRFFRSFNVSLWGKGKRSSANVIPPYKESLWRQATGYNRIDRPENEDYTGEKQGGGEMLKVACAEIIGCDGHETAFALLKTLFREETGRTIPEIARTDRGKPYFPDEEIYFSITHTKKHAFCALSDCPVGIDVEELDRKINPGLAVTLAKTE